MMMIHHYHDVQTNTLLWAYFRERYLTYPPEDLTLLKRKEKEDLEEDDVDDDSEGEKGTYSSASCCRLIRV